MRFTSLVLLAGASLAVANPWSQDDTEDLNLYARYLSEDLDIYARDLDLDERDLEFDHPSHLHTRSQSLDFQDWLNKRSPLGTCACITAPCPCDGSSSMGGGLGGLGGLGSGGLGNGGKKYPTVSKTYKKPKTNA